MLSIAPLCGCKCGLKVKPSKFGGWNTFIHGHSVRSASGRKRISESQYRIWSTRDRKAFGLAVTKRLTKYTDAERKLGKVTERMFRVYGITYEQYLKLERKQNYRCAICRTKDKGNGRNGKRKFWCIDHDHARNSARGLLCVQCNAGLGQFRDKIFLLRAAIYYLKLFGNS